MRIPLRRMLRPAQRVGAWFYERTLGRIPGPVLVSSYRKEFFGDAWIACMQEGMRGARCWSVSETELFAAFVSSRNRCGF